MAENSSGKIDEIISLLKETSKQNQNLIRWTKIMVVIAIVNGGFLGAILKSFTSWSWSTFLIAVAVILAITIILAAAVYVWISGFGAKYEEKK